MNRLPADDSHDISRLIGFETIYLKMSSAAVVIVSLTSVLDWLNYFELFVYLSCN